MADTPDWASLFGGSAADLQGLQGLLSMMAPSEDEKKQARLQAILTAGLGMMGTPKGLEWQGLGRAGLAGVQQYNADLKALGQQRGQNVTQAAQLLPLIRQMQWQKEMAGLGQVGGTPYAQGVQGATGSDLATGDRATMGMGGGASALFGQGPQTATAPGQTGNATVDAALRLGVPMAAIRLAKGPDEIGKLIADYAKPESYRPGGYRVVGGVAQQMPVAQPGFVNVPDESAPGGFKSVRMSGGQEAVSTNAAIPKIIGEMFTPQEGIIPGTNRTGIVGSRAGAMGITDLQSGLNKLGLQPQAQQQAPPQQPQTPYQVNLAPGTDTPAARAAIAADWAANGPNAPSGRQPVVTHLSPEESAFQAGQGKNWAEYQNTVDTQAAAAADLKAKTDYLRNLSPHTKFGRFTPMQGNFAAYALDIPGIGESIANAILPNASTNVPVLQDWNKQVIQLGSNATRLLGAREAQQIFQKQMEAQANPSMTQKGAFMVLDSMEGGANALLAKQQDMQKWIRDNPTGTPDGFEAYWNKTHPASSFMPSPSQIQRVLSGKDPMQEIGGQQAVPKLTPIGSGNATVNAILRANPSPQQLDALRRKGYIE